MAIVLGFDAALSTLLLDPSTPLSRYNDCTDTTMKEMREKLDKYKGRVTISAARDGRIEGVICKGINKVCMYCRSSPGPTMCDCAGRRGLHGPNF